MPNTGRAILTCAVLVLAGCASNAAVYSSKLAKDAAPPSNFDVVYLERSLTTPGARDPVNSVIAQFGYFDLAPQLAEHGPRVFSANGMEARFYRALPSAPLVQRNKAASPLLLEFTQGRISSQGPVVKTVSLLLIATLYDQESAQQRVWTGQFRVHLGHDPALGVGKTTSVNQQFVEDLLVLVLEQMSKDQVLALKGPNVIRPTALRQ